jgi:hypothetical protein
VEFESPHRATAPPSRRGTRQWSPRRASPYGQGGADASAVPGHPRWPCHERAGHSGPEREPIARDSPPDRATIGEGPPPRSRGGQPWSGWPRQTAPRPGPAPLPAASRSVNSSRGTLRRHAGLRADMVDLAYGAHPVALPMITTCLRRRQRGPLRPAGRIASRFADRPSPLVPWVQGVTGGGR